MPTKDGTKFLWVPQSDYPRIPWETLIHFYRQHGMLRNLSDLPSMGECHHHLTLDGATLVGNDKGEIIITSFPTPSRSVSDFAKLFDHGFLDQAAYDEAMAQLNKAAGIRQEADRVRAEANAWTDIRAYCFARPLGNLERKAETFSSLFVLEGTSSEMVDEDARAIKDAIDEILELRSMSQEELFAHLLRIKTVEVIRVHGDSPENERLNCLHRVKKPQDLIDFYTSWER